MLTFEKEVLGFFNSLPLSHSQNSKGLATHISSSEENYRIELLASSNPDQIVWAYKNHGVLEL